MLTPNTEAVLQHLKEAYPTAAEMAAQQPRRDPETAKKPTYISYCRVCGGMTGCCAADDSNSASAAEFAREVIAAKQILERETVAEVWNGKWCICHDTTNTDAQASLFE